MVNKKPEPFLNKLGEFGFDECGNSRSSFSRYCAYYYPDKIIKNTMYEEWHKETVFIKLFALNKSALEAMAKMIVKGTKVDGHPAWSIQKVSSTIQGELIENITNKKSEGFWELCYQLTGWEG